MKKELLRKRLQEMDMKYDEKECLIMIEVKQNNFNPAHSNIKKICNVHSVLDSMRYAMLLIESENKYSEKADNIIKKVLSLQNHNPFRKYYGLWPYFLEDPIDKIKYPDYNTATFVLRFLLTLYLKYKNIIPDDTRQMIKSSCLAATTFIIDRNTTLRYSHIVIEECYTCVLCGEIFSRLDFINYGMHKMEKFLNFTNSCGDFFEFNSPHYSFYIASLLSSILKDVKNTRVLNATHELNKILWYSIASHYHYTTGQISGPHSRTINDFLGHETKYHINKIAGNTTLLTENNFQYDPFDTDLLCPPQYYPFFANKKTIEYSQRLIFPGQTYPNYAHSYTATTYSVPEFTLGSFNQYNFWREARPLIGYFGTKESPYCAKVTCLLNGNEFTSSLLHCAQTKNSLIATVNFATDRGVNYMPQLNTPNKPIDISDLRLRFTIIGNPDELKVTRKRNRLYVKYDNLSINFNYNYYKSDIFTPCVELSVNKNNICFDLVFYKGKKQKFDFSASECTITQFSLLFSDKNEECAHIRNTLSKQILTTVQKFKDYEIRLKTHVKPQSWVYLTMNDHQLINDTTIENYAKDNEESALQYQFTVESASENPISITDNSNTTVDKILTMIEKIPSLDFNEITDECTEILQIIKNYDVPLDIAKRLAVRIITNIFEVATNYNAIFESIIKYEYSNIYINLSQDNSIEAIEKTIINILDKIKLDYRLHSENKKNKDFINAVTDIINNNFNNSSMSLTYISEHIGMDESHISKTFHKRTGMTYLQYLTHVRMEHAKSMIKSGIHDPELISSQCGYENISSFLRAFKKHTGHTLGSFKKKNNI